MTIERPFPHEDADQFRSCIAFTAKEKDFAPNLVEKDYFCSLVLSALDGCGDDLVFKGGTCLGKVFLDFFRLSEDLDFGISLPFPAMGPCNLRPNAGPPSNDRCRRNCTPSCAAGISAVLSWGGSGAH